MSPRSESIELQQVSEAQKWPSGTDANITENADEATLHTPLVYPAGIQLAFITLGLVLSIFLAALDSTIVSTAIPSITASFGSISNIAWYGSAYSITNTAFQSTWGKAYKYFRLKRTFLLAIAVFELGNVTCALAPNSNTLILGRVIAGLGGGGIMTGAFIMIALTARPEHRAAYMGILGVTFGCASVLGPLMGGVLTDGPGFRWCFWINLPFGATAAGTIAYFFSQPQGTTPVRASLREKVIQMDLPGGILITAALTCFVMAMHWGGTLAWSSTRVIASLVAFVALGIAFVLNEWYMGSKAMIQAHLLKKRRILINLGYIFFLAGLYFPLLYTLSIQFQSIDNNTASQSGIRLIPLVLGISIFTMVSNGLLTWWKTYTFYLVMGGITGTIGVSMMHTLDETASVKTWIGYELLAAFGIGLSLQIPMISNQAAVSNDDIPAATSLSLFMENMGTSLFVAAAEGAFTKGLVTGLSQHAPSLDPMAVVDAGVTQIRTVFPESLLPGILMSYLDGCKISHVISMCCGALASLISLGSLVGIGSRDWKRWLRKAHVP